MVLPLLPKRGGAVLSEAASGVQPDNVNVHQVQEVPECPVNNLHYTDNRLKVIVSIDIYSLDDTVDRNCDYLLVVNVFTAYLLQTIGKFKESINFLSVAEKMLHKLMANLQHETKAASSESDGASTPAEQEVVGKHQSQMTKTLLSNSLLAISLMKNIGMKFTNPRLYQSESLA